jgi:GT2 family glycosyltransferase
MSVPVSVVVPTCGRPELLRRCVAALEAQTLPSAQYEIVIVDDTTSRRGPAAARNIGWRRGSAPIIAFTDDDTIPQSDWLEEGLRAMRPEVDALAGRIIMPVPATPTDYERNQQGLERAAFVTANCFVRRDVLERLGGFDESFRLAWREDADLHFRLLEAGCTVARAPDAVVVHPLRPAPWSRLYRSHIRRAPRWDYYAVVASLALSVASPWWLIVWAALTARFCVARLRGTSKSPRHVAEMVLTSILIPPLSVFWRAVGALKFRVTSV